MSSSPGSPQQAGGRGKGDNKALGWLCFGYLSCLEEGLLGCALVLTQCLLSHFSSKVGVLTLSLN